MSCFLKNESVCVIIKVYIRAEGYMVKKIVFVMVMLFTSALLFAGENEDGGSDNPQSQKPEFGFDMNIGIGLSSYEDSNGDQITFQKFSFIPEFSYGKWGLGLNFTFELDGNFHLRDLDNDGNADTWTTLSDYVYKLYYLRYAHKGDPLYGRIGAITNYTLGHGTIMEGFSNTLFYPQVLQLGLNFDIDGGIFNFPVIGFESVVDDVLDWDIIGFRFYARPLYALSTPIIKDLKLGASLVVDTDPQEDTTSEDYGPPHDNPASNTVIVYGLDSELPLFDRGDMSLITYADWAKIGGKGNGTVLGSTYRYNWFKLIAQLRFLGKEFVVNYFDPWYEKDRAFKYDSLNAVTDFYMGYLIGTDIRILNLFSVYFTWDDGFNDEPGPRIRTGIATQENALAKLEAGITYDKKDVDDFGDFFSLNDSLFQLKVGYKITRFAKIVFIQQRSYTPSGKSANQTLVETQFSF